MAAKTSSEHSGTRFRGFRRGWHVMNTVAELVRPPRRMLPSEACARYLFTEKGAWSADLVPYMIEPLDQIGRRDYRGVVFVGPARTGKSMALVLGGVGYIVTCAPGDSLVVHMTQDAARDFSRTDLDRAIRYSPELAARLSPRARDDNTYDKFFRSGIAIKIGWPAISQLSAKTLQYVIMTDYDRPENVDNIDGEGPMFYLGMKRTETLMSRGKTIAESSPGEDFADPDWKPEHPHEAPPCKGILSVYNDGTRAMRYLPCQSCGEFFLARPDVNAFAIPRDFEEVCEAVKAHDLSKLAADWFRVPCPHCGTLHEQQQRRAMSQGGVWLHHGETIDGAGRISGERRWSDIASYWMSGIEAAYQTWHAIGYNYLKAVRTYIKTRDEGPLRKSTNTDIGAPYMPRAASMRRSADVLRSRKETAWTKGHVPRGVRFLTASVDVQRKRFVVQVQGWGVELESWVIDRFHIVTSDRLDDVGRALPLNPAAYAEDWHVLYDSVISRKYPLLHCPDIKIGPLLTLSDSGGEDGVTDKAYAFWRKMRDDGHGHRFNLLKGTGYPQAPRIQRTWPDARDRKDRSAGRGDVPIWVINTNVLKDGVAGDLDRQVPGPGYIHVPEDMEADYFDELIAETRTAKGWDNLDRKPNEAFDLHAYNRAAVIVLGAEGIDWSNPPQWALDPIEQARVEVADTTNNEQSGSPTQPQSSGGSGWLSSTRRRSFW